jgi:hypothetical protein
VSDDVGGVHAAVRFLLEMGALVAYGYWGVRAVPGTTSLVLGVGIPLVVATLWAVFAAPKSPRRLAGRRLVAFEAAVFGGAALALVAAGRPILGVCFAAVAVVNRLRLRSA